MIYRFVTTVQILLTCEAMLAVAEYGVLKERETASFMNGESPEREIKPSQLLDVNFGSKIGPKCDQTFHQLATSGTISH